MLTPAAVPLPSPAAPRRYSVFLEQGQQLMLSARKRKKTTSSYYVIGLDPDNLSRDSKACFGKLKANFVGTGFSFFAAGAAKVGGGQIC
jgi:tubby-related protein 1